MSDGGSLSQEEIDALLNGGGGAQDDSSSPEPVGEELTTEEKDTVGEIANISMGSAATALFSLVNTKVDISTPVVSTSTWTAIIDEYDKPCVLVKITYTKGLSGSNELVLKESDAKIITDLMMGGDGTNTDGELTEIHLSAISEAMNQMMGSSATSLSSMLNKMVDISPPTSNLIELDDVKEGSEFGEFINGTFVKIEFNLQIGDLVDSKMMQLYPISLVREMISAIKGNMEADSDSNSPEAATQEVGQVPQSEMQMGSLETAQQPAAAPQAAPQMAPQMAPQQMAPQMMPQMMPQGQPVDVQTAQFSAFTGASPVIALQENIDLIKDVPLEVTVELGRTHKSIQEILDFAPGTIIELNKIAGEPIDVLVNGKYVAKGEVVVIEESFGIRITEILTD